MLPTNCARVAVRTALKVRGLFDPDSPDIDPEIAGLIANRIEDGAYHFRVVTEA